VAQIPRKALFRPGTAVGALRFLPSLPQSAKFSPFQMERFANAVIGPAKIAYLFDRRGLSKNLIYKFK
jgi:hypothetical protein